MRTRLIITGLGNLIDLVSTLYLYRHGFEEMNPLMAGLLQYPPLFMLVKIGAMTWALWILWKRRDHKSAQRISWFAAVLYGSISLYYAFFLTILFLFAR